MTVDGKMDIFDCLYEPIRNRTQNMFGVECVDEVCRSLSTLLRVNIKES